MSSCMDPMPGAFHAGGVCSGFGTCINSTLTPGLRLCACAAGYSGASDFFDTRVEKLPNGTWLSYSCNEAAVGTYVIWSLFCLGGLLRVYKITPLWLQFVKRHYADESKRVGGFWNDISFRIVTFDLFGVSIPYLVTGFCKLNRMALGTDILPTLALCATVLFFQLVIFDLTRTEFNIFIATTGQAADKAKRFRTTCKCIGLALYFLLNTVPTLWSLSTDKTKGPLVGGNYEVLVIYIRNMGAVGWGLFEIFTTWLIRKRVAALVSCSQATDSAVSYVVTKMDKELKSLVIFMTILTTMYAIFTTELLLPYQTYLIAFIVALGSARNSAAAITNEKEARSKGVMICDTKAKIDLTGNSKSNSGRENKDSQIEIPCSISPRNLSSNTQIALSRQPSDLSKSSTANGDRGEVNGLLPITLQSSLSAPST